MAQTIRQQLQANAVALISLVVALGSLGYNTWRNELTEESRSVRLAAFEVLKNQGELQVIVNFAFFAKNDQLQPFTGCRRDEGAVWRARPASAAPPCLRAAARSRCHRRPPASRTAAETQQCSRPGGCAHCSQCGARRRAARGIRGRRGGAVVRHPQSAGPLRPSKLPAPPPSGFTETEPIPFEPVAVPPPMTLSFQLECLPDG